jgi:hypothetical protein
MSKKTAGVRGNLLVYLQLFLVQSAEVVRLVSREAACTKRSGGILSSPVGVG